MVRPLTKHKRDGDRYTRPVNIEAVIDAALALDWPELHKQGLQALLKSCPA